MEYFSEFKMDEGKIKYFKTKKDVETFLRKNGDGAKMKIDPDYGGGKGTFVDFSPSGLYIILKTKDGQETYNLADVGY